MIAKRPKGYSTRWAFVTDRKILVSACLPLIVYFTSCQSPHFYRPKPVEPVLLTHQGQAKINLISVDEDLYASNFNAISMAYSPAEHFGLAGGIGFFRGGREIGESYFNPYLSAGYYRKLSLHTFLETYGGIALYNYKNKNDVAVKSINFYNYFVQPSFAIVNKNIEVALTLRMDYLKRYKTITGNNYSPDTFNPDFAFLRYNSYLFFQPGCTVRFGFRYIKLQLQLAKSNPFSNKYNSIYGRIYPGGDNTNGVDNSVKWSTGITLDLAALKKTGEVKSKKNRVETKESKKS